MVTHITKVWINRIRLPVLHVVSRTAKMNISLFAFVPENLVSRDIEWFKLCGECSVWESRLVCKKAVARVKLLVPDFHLNINMRKCCFANNEECEISAL